jgi:hypothetical protein
MPHPWKRKKLAEIAEREGHIDLAEIFSGDASHWRLAIALNTELSSFSNFMTKLEICALNADVGQNTDEEAHIAMKSLKATVEKFLNFLIERSQSGDAPLLYDSLQRNVWADLINGRDHAVAPIRRESATLRARPDRETSERM